MESAAVAVTLLWMVAATEIVTPIHFFQYLTVAIHHYDDADNVANLRNPLGNLRRCIGPSRTPRTGRHHQRASPSSAFTHCELPPNSAPTIAHLRDVLGDQTYESLARKGETMTTAAMVTYAYDQIDQARAELEHPS